MASRSYNLAFDNPYNQRIAEVLKKYDMNRDTNGEPDLMMYTNSRLVGGSHPHMVHMGIKEEVPYTPLPRPNRSMNPRRRYMDEMMGAGRPPGGVSPYVEPLNPNQLVDAGTMATYPIYNALEMKSIGGGCCPCMDRMGEMKPAVIVVEKEKKKGGKRKSYGKKVLGDVGKIGKEVGVTVLKDLAKEAIKSAFKPGAKAPTGGKRGRKKRETQMEPEPKPEEMFTEVQQGGLMMAVGDKRSDEQKSDDAKKTQKTVKKTVKKVFGGKAGDGRAKRAEIVKKIMKEKGMKMIEASKYVKANNLY